MISKIYVIMKNIKAIKQDLSWHVRIQILVEWEEGIYNWISDDCSELATNQGVLKSY